MWAKAGTPHSLKRMMPSTILGRSRIAIGVRSVQGQVSMRYHGSSIPPKPPLNPIARFFAAYPTFNYNPTFGPSSSPAAEFRTLCEHMEWGRKGHQRKAARREFQNALEMWFNKRYGADAENLEAWQKLCMDLRVSPVPGALERARKTVFNTHVNLMDFDDVRLDPDLPLKRFATEKQLSEYTLKTGRIVSPSSPQADGLLKALLRYILKPPDEALRRDEFGCYIVNRRVNVKPGLKKEEPECKEAGGHGEEGGKQAQPGPGDGSGGEATTRRKPKKNRRKATQKTAQPATVPV